MPALVIDVRNASPADAAELAAVHAEAWREAYAGIIPGVTLAVMIARRGPSWWRSPARLTGLLALQVGPVIAGYATIRGHWRPANGKPGRAGEAAELQEIYLRPVYQGIGLGRRLFDAAAARARRGGARRLLVRALADNDRAAAFYERRGCVLVACGEETLGGRTLPCLWFELLL